MSVRSCGMLRCKLSPTPPRRRRCVAARNGSPATSRTFGQRPTQCRTHDLLRFTQKGVAVRSHDRHSHSAPSSSEQQHPRGHCQPSEHGASRSCRTPPLPVLTRERSRTSTRRAISLPPRHGGMKNPRPTDAFLGATAARMRRHRHPERPTSVPALHARYSRRQRSRSPASPLGRRGGFPSRQRLLTLTGHYGRSFIGAATSD